MQELDGMTLRSLLLRVISKTEVVLLKVIFSFVVHVVSVVIIQQAQQKLTEVHRNNLCDGHIVFTLKVHRNNLPSDIVH